MNLKAHDIDFERKSLTVKAETSKSKRGRSVQLNSPVLMQLRDYVEERKKRGYTTPYFFVSHLRDDRLTYDGFKHVIERVVRASGISFHIHQFRHTYAVNLLKKGCNIVELKQLMGHTDIRMTAAYLRCIPTDAMNVAVESLRLDNLV